MALYHVTREQGTLVAPRLCAEEGVGRAKRKKNTGRRVILGLVLAARGDVQYNMLAERGANKSDGWGLGSFDAKWSMRPAGGKLMRPKAETRSVLLMDGVWAVPPHSGPCNTAGGELMRPKAETRIVLRRAVWSARSRKMFSVWYVPGGAPAISLLLWSPLEEEGRSLH